MTAHEIRAKFIAFFVKRGHTAIASASLIPENDPSVLFTTAGMHPLVPYLLGEPHPHGNRLVDSQKCVRTGDIDDVGDNRHLTFFEMLGNWSLGDYFKKESITWSYEFLTDPVDGIGLSPSRLAVTVFEGDSAIPRDDESVAIWKSLGIPDERIVFLGKEDNWWPAGGKHPGPQGPDTEIFYWTGTEVAPTVYDPADNRWVEIWNNVFMQFSRDAVTGALSPLVKKNVDTGMGLERITTAVQGKQTVFETELFMPLFARMQELGAPAYGSSDDVTKAMRVVADHIKAATFIIGDDRGVTPSNVDQGYIVRRLLRRAIRHGRKLGLGNEFCVALSQVVIAMYADVYSELARNQDKIFAELAKEEKKFGNTLAQGEREFEKIVKKTGGSLSGEDAFLLFSSFGFPLELTLELAQEKGITVDRDVFAAAFKAHQDLSRQGAGQKFAGGLADSSPKTIHGHTATHLLHKALRTVLGDHVMQKGSNITSERLRFDFSHGAKMTDEEIAAVEKIVNEQITRDLPVTFDMMTVDEAKNSGAIGLFEDTYAQVGDKIKVYRVGDFSAEICGGPHVSRTSEIGGFKIVKEEAVSSGIRRIKAVTGQGV